MALGTQSVSCNTSRQRACSGYNSAHLEPSNENDSFIQMQNSPNDLKRGVRAVSPPEPLGKGGICEAAPILGVHPQTSL